MAHLCSPCSGSHDGLTKSEIMWNENNPFSTKLGKQRGEDFHHIPICCLLWPSQGKDPVDGRSFIDNFESHPKERL